MISLFTLLIRLGLVRENNESLQTLMSKFKNKEIKTYFTEGQEIDEESFVEDDSDKVVQSENGINRILKYGDRKLFYSDILKNYPCLIEDKDEFGPDMFTIHEHCGIASYSLNKTKQLFPYWHRLEKGVK